MFEGPWWVHRVFDQKIPGVWSKVGRMSVFFFKKRLFFLRLKFPR